ncbi:hypothetical protein DL765_010863 [Monosporascus sp. GIB2]|nr:hypothetical protein DL765_010863 [Monosporascus sp. GIB2]
MAAVNRIRSDPVLISAPDKSTFSVSWAGHDIVGAYDIVLLIYDILASAYYTYVSGQVGPVGLRATAAPAMPAVIFSGSRRYAYQQSS